MESKSKQKSKQKSNQKPKQRFPASLTVEAAICLPLFLFTALMLLSPLRMLDERRKLQNVMEAAAKDMAKAAYAEQLLKENGTRFLNRNPKNEGTGTEHTGNETAEGLLEGLNTGYTAGRVLSSLDPELIQNAYFTKCEIIRNDMIEMELQYDLQFPFRIFWISELPMSSVVNRRAWTGSAGGRGADLYGPGGEDADGYDSDEEGDAVVYVGKTSTVYHKDRHCHYLDNVLQTADAAAVPELRNASGGKYHACDSCKPGDTGTVYIMKSGTAYHADSGCKAIQSYVKEIKLKEAAHLGACSYCSGG